MGEWCNENGSKSTRKKIYLAKGLKYFEQAKVGEFKCESNTLEVGDEVIITGPTTGYVNLKVEELRVEGKSATKAKKGDVFTIAMKEKIRPSDKLYKLVPEKNGADHSAKS
jgi:putative protease